MKKRLFSFVLALSMICTMMAGLGGIAGAVAAEDEKIAEFDAAMLRNEYDNRENTSDSAATIIARFGISLKNCWSGGENALGADATNTGGTTVIRYGFSNSATTADAERGGFDFTQNSSINPNPVAMTDGVYMVESQLINFINDGNNRKSYIRYELRGLADGTAKTIARLRFDHVTSKIYLVDASDTVIGTQVAQSFGAGNPVPAYVRFVVDLNNKTYSAYYAKHETVSNLGTVPESLTVLAQNQPFINNDVTQLTRLDISGLFPGGGNTMAGFYNVKASKMADTTADKTTVTYDKKDGGSLDIALTPVSHRLQKITLDSADLAADYYTVSGNTYTIAEETLKALANGSHTLTFVMDGGANPEVALTVENTSSAPTYTVTAKSADDTMGSAAVTSPGSEFEAGASAKAEATPKAGYEFTGWTAEGLELTEEQKTQNPITITMPAANVTLTAAFGEKKFSWSLDPTELLEAYRLVDTATTETGLGDTSGGQRDWLPGAAGITIYPNNAYAYTHNIYKAADTHQVMSLLIKWRKDKNYIVGSNYDFTADTTFNPSPKAIAGGSYCLEMDFNASMSPADTYVDYIFKGNSGNILIVRADKATKTVSLRDGEGNVIGTAHTLDSDTNTAVYLRLEFDMDQKKVNAWAGNYAAVSDVGVKVNKAPALDNCTKLVMGGSFLNQSTQLTGMDIYAQTGAGSDGPNSNIYGIKIEEVEDITTPPETYTVTVNSTDSAKGTAAVTTAGESFEAGTSVTVEATPKAGNKFTGWTGAGITLTEAQKMQNPLTITMPAENVTLTAAFAAKTNAAVTPTIANYDKYAENVNHKDITVTLTAGDYTFGTLKNGSAALKAETDYTVSGNTYTIKTSYLDTLATGAQTLTFEMDGGINPAVVITVADSTPPTYTVTVNSTDTAKGTVAVTTTGTAFEAGTSVTVEATTKTGNKFTGWTATGITLTEAQKMQNPLTITMPAVNVTVTATFVAKTNASVTPATADYDKYTENANHKDIAVTLTSGDYTFRALKNSTTTLTLTEGTDYTVSGNVYTIKTSYLDTLAKGERTLMFEMDGGTNPTVVITVANSTPVAPPTYTVTANSADEEKGTVAVKTGVGGPFEAGVRVTIEATPKEGNKFTGWTATGITLTEEQKTQNPLMIFMPAENVTLAAAFAEKINASVTPTTADYDKYTENANHKDIAVTLTPGDYTFQALKNNTTTLTLTEGIDYTVSGNVYTIKTSYLETLAKGERTLMFEMDGGTNPTVVITVENSTPTPPPTYTVTANSADEEKGTVAVKTGVGGPFEAGVRVTIEATPTAGNKFTGWTATGIALTEEQQKQNPLMIFMPAENVTLTAVFAEAEDSSITPAKATYDKYVQGTDHKDLAFTLKTADAAVEAVKLGEAVLEETTDYTLNEGILTISSGVLDKQTGDILLTVTLDSGDVLTAEISIIDTTAGLSAHKVTVSAGTGGTARISGSKTEFLSGETVTVTAVASSGYSFSNWRANGVAVSVSGTTATFIMPDSDVTVYAYFTKDQQSVGVGGRPQRSSSTNAGAIVVPAGTGNTNTNNNYQEPSVDYVSSNYFGDVSTESTWAYGYIEHLASAGIVSGDQNRNFAPKNNVTREEFLKMLMGALNIEATVAGEGFSDVRSGDWFAPYIYTARNLGIVNGMGDGTFGIGQSITREDMAVMASRALAAAGKTLIQTQQPALVDAVQISEYAQSSVQQLASAGVLCGNEYAAFRPLDNALREEAAKVIYFIWIA